MLHSNVSRSRLLRRFAGSKVPEITLMFWVAKILSTAMGEATSDYSVFHINPYLAVVAGALGFLVTLIWQLTRPIYRPWAYWLLVVMIGIFGTMVADVIHVVLGVPYRVSTVLFAVSLLVILLAWYRTEGTLSIHSIDTPRRELFYWATVVATFALGTAAGDLTAISFHLGFFGSAILFTALFAIPGLCYWLLGLNDVAAFWTAYILTRPMGASFADWFDKPHIASGLGFGDGPTSAVLTVGVLAAIAYVGLAHRRLRASVRMALQLSE